MPIRKNKPAMYPHGDGVTQILILNASQLAPLGTFIVLNFIIIDDQILLR